MANYKTKKIGNVNAVALADLGLKYGTISPQNSVPYIDVAHAQKMIDLDNQMGVLGSPYTITSAMGGQHQPGSRSHSAGAKIDIAPKQGAFSKAAQNYLTKNFVGNGAIGNEGNHWDLSFLAGGGNNPNAMNQQPILRQSPGLINANPQMMDLYQSGAITNAQIYDAMKKAQEELAAKYDIAKAIQSSEGNINRATEQAIPNIRETLGYQVDEPMELEMQEMYAARNQDLQRQQANRDLALAQMEYYKQRTPEQMSNDYNAQVQAFLNYMQGQNPYVQNMQSENPVQYNVNMDDYRKAQARDNTYRTYMMGAAMMNAQSNPQLAQIQMQAAQQGLGGQAEQYLKNAQLEYQTQLANQTGLPPEQVNAMAQHQMKMAEQLAPSVASAYKEATVLQPNQNLRTYVSEVPKVSEDIYKDTVSDEQGRLKEMIDRNKMYQEANKIVADAQVEALKQANEMYKKYPQQVLEKYQTEAGNISKPNQALIQSEASMTNQAMETLQKNTQNINTQLEKAYEEQGKDLRKFEDLVSQQAKQVEKSNSNVDDLKVAQQKQQLVNATLSKLVDPITGNLKAGSEIGFGQQLLSTGQFTQEEVARLIRMYYSGGQQGK